MQFTEPIVQTLALLSKISGLTESIKSLSGVKGILPGNTKQLLSVADCKLNEIGKSLGEAQLQAIARLSSLGTSDQTIADMAGLSVAEVKGLIFYYQTQRIAGSNIALLANKIERTTLSVRARNCLIANDIKTLGDLIDCTEKQVLKSPNLGPKLLSEVKAMLAGFGLKLKE